MIAIAKGIFALLTGGVETYREHKKAEANKVKRRDDMEREQHNAKVKRLQSGDENAASLDMMNLKKARNDAGFFLLMPPTS